MIWLGAIAVVAGVLGVLLIIGMLHNHAAAIRELTAQLHQASAHQIVAGKVNNDVVAAQLQRVVEALMTLWVTVPDRPRHH